MLNNFNFIVKGNLPTSQYNMLAQLNNSLYFTFEFCTNKPHCFKKCVYFLKFGFRILQQKD